MNTNTNETKTTISIRSYHHVGGQTIDCGYPDTYATVDEARARIAELRDEANEGKFDDYDFQIVSVNDDPESEDYCHVVEVIDSL